MKRVIGIACFGAVLVWCVLGPKPWKVLAQADAGYTKIGSSVTTTYTDSTVADGLTYSYEVTAFNAAGESTPTPMGNGTIPATGTHTATVTWTAGSGGSPAAGYNVYRETVSVPNQPGAGSVTVN
jgi:hypothetical protein